MDGQFKDKKTVNSLNIDVKSGSFALDQPPLKFETCRERFAASFTAETPGFFFKTEPQQGPEVARFLWKTEAILNEEVRSNFALTNWDTILWVSPSPFWKNCPLRRSLLTILLRAGNLYNSQHDNYEDALFSQDYVKPTKRAVMRFLFGFTKYEGPELVATGTLLVRGWKTIFDNMGEEEVKRNLVWPKERPYKFQIEVSTALWQ